MKEIRKFQCEHCNTVYDYSEHAQKCESTHILHPEIVIVRGVHKRKPPLHSLEGLWPEYLIVGMHNIRNILVRYEFKGPEEFDSIDPFIGDQYYNVDKK